MEKNPSQGELAEARERGRADAAEAHRTAAEKSVADEAAGDAGPYAFAPEALQAEYDRAFSERLEELRASG